MMFASGVPVPGTISAVAARAAAIDSAATTHSTMAVTRAPAVTAMGRIAERISARMCCPFDPLLCLEPHPG